MAVTHTIADGVLTLELAGTYEPADVVREFLAALESPGCPRPVFLLVDVTRSQSLATRSGKEIAAIAQFLGPYAARIGGRCAVVTMTDVQFGLAQMGSVAADHVGVDARVFRTGEAALEWLRSPAPGRRERGTASR